VRAASGGVRSDVVRGKPSYMSPEQVSGEPLDGRADLYAAGVMLWEMLADRPLFTGTAREITAQVMFKDIARPSSYCSTVPADLEAVAMTLLAHDREDRYATAGTAIEALLGCADVPRDGRGELVQLLAGRFRPGPDGRAPLGPAAGEPRGPRVERVTVPAPPSLAAVSAAEGSVARPRRGRFTATLCVVVIAGVVAAMLARGEVAQSRTTDRAAPPRPPATVPGMIAPRAPLASFGSFSSAGAHDRAPADAGVADAGLAPAAHAPDTATPPLPRREGGARTGRIGELAIIVRPWAMIWLNGKPSGQTPFRAAVPAGRYRVRLANEDAGHDEVTTVTVEPDQTATVERSW
jgi:serine/threonine-protein kinase